jgi:DNA helicase-2/ATP-dependent DNA helicase PcrA
MGRTLIVYGPAGTGKTTFVVEHLFKKLNDDELGETIALSFSRAAKSAILEKESRLSKRQVRTLHSICFYELGLTRKNILDEKTIAEFMGQMGLPFSVDQILDDEMEEKEIGNVYLKWYGRLLNEAPMFCNEKREIELRKFVFRYYDELKEINIKNWMNFVYEFSLFQEEAEKYSYDMILYKAFRAGISFSGRYLVLDEAQDLSPVMCAILKENMKNFEEIWILGDDDQTIYTRLNGANAEFLLDMRADKKIVLDKSHRLPRKIWELAVKYISLNEHRVNKPFKHNGQEGKIARIASLEPWMLDVKDNETVFILCRHRKQVAKVRQMLERLDIPHVVMGTRNTASKKEMSLLSALAAYEAIRKCEGRVTIGMWNEMLKNLKEEIVIKVFKKDRKELKGIFTFDKTGKELAKDFPVLHAVFSKIPPVFLFDAPAVLIERWYRRLTKLSEWQNPKVYVGTIHQSKGLEADRVILDLSVNTKVYNNLKTEYERRVWYVAVTRAKKELFLLPGRQFNYELLSLAS